MLRNEPSTVAYVPTLPDARAWAKTTEKFMFVQALLDLSLFGSHWAYAEQVSRRVDAVETAFERLLADSNSN